MMMMNGPSGLRKDFTFSLIENFAHVLICMNVFNVINLYGVSAKTCGVSSGQYCSTWRYHCVRITNTTEGGQ